MLALLALAVLVPAAVAALLGEISGKDTGFASDIPGRDESPSVDAAGPPVRAEVLTPPPPPRPPDEALERLPVTRAALDLPSLAPHPGAYPVAPGEIELAARSADSGSAGEDGETGARLYEFVPLPMLGPDLPGPLRIEYTLDAELTRQVFKVLRNARVALGHVILLDPTNGRILAYASTDVERFPPTRAYPAASLVKVITAAAALDADPQKARLPCRFRGSPYKLTPSRIDPPRQGREVSLRRALATSNNQCFAQLAVHAVGAEALVDAIARFGWLNEPARAHAAGSVDAGKDRFDVGKLGCGLAGCRITPLHAAQLAATLAHGELVSPRWIDRIIDGSGRELPIPAVAAPRRVLSPELTDELREMLVDTTTRGTARSAFRRRNGRPLLGPVKVAGKTGSLSGRNPDGRYEWFIGAAPATTPRVAIAVLLVQGHLWWRNASQVAAEVLRHVFCSDGPCRDEGVERWTRVPETTARLGIPLDRTKP